MLDKGRKALAWFRNPGRLIRWARRRPVNALFAVAVTIMLIRTAFLPIPAPFPLWASVGDLFWNVALSYSGAWFFNRLVIELPKRRDRAKVYSTSARGVKDIAATGISLAKAIYQTAGMEFPGKLDSKSLDEAMRKIKFSSHHPFLVTATGQTGRETQPATWNAAFPQAVRDIDNAVARLQPVYSYYDAEMIEIVERITRNYLFELAHSGHMQRFIDGMEFPSMRSVVEELWYGCSQLDDYYEKHLAQYTSPPERFSTRFPDRNAQDL